MQATFLIDGAPLDDPDGRWFLISGTEIASGASLRTVDSTVPGMDGSYGVDYEPVDVPSLVMSLAVTGKDRAEMLARYGALARILAPTGAVTITRVLDGVALTAQARGKSISDPDINLFGPLLKFTATLRLPGVYWRGTPATWSRTGVTSGAEYVVTTLDGSTAPVRDAQILVTGPVTDPKVTCGDSWAQLGLTVAAGDSALIDCVAWSVKVGTGLTFGGSGTTQTGSLTASPGDYLLPLTPRMTATDPMKLQVPIGVEGSGMSGATSLAVRAASAFRV